MLYVLNLLVRVTATQGEPGGSPSIRFAHWSGLTAGILRNFRRELGKPPERFHQQVGFGPDGGVEQHRQLSPDGLLSSRGRETGPLFIDWARASQCPTAAWHRAYPNTTMPNIESNTTLGQRLFGSLPEEEIPTWLRRL